jgi:hypothetical protein
MRFTGGASRSSAVSVRTALGSLVALAAVIVALVLMHGMSGAHTVVAHTGTASAATAESTSAGPTAGHESDDHLPGVHTVTIRASVFHDAVFPTGPAPTDLTETGGEPWLGLAILCLFLLVSLALVLRLAMSRSDRPTRSRVLVTGGPSTLVRAIPLRLAISIDRR